MKLTLLEYVQDILNDMDSDEVNSIDDTSEAGQVAQIVKSTYMAMMSSNNWPHLRKTLRLQASGDVDKPTHMSILDSVKQLMFINYNCVKEGETRLRYEAVKHLEPDEFLRLTNGRNSDNDNVQVVEDFSGVKLLILNDKKPDHYTSFDDKHLVFDSYDISVDDTLQNSKTQAQGYVFPSWEAMDNFVPDLPDEAVPALLEEAKSRAMFKLKQMTDMKAEQESARQRRWLSRNSRRINGGIIYPNYGRKGGRSRRDPTFTQNR